MGWFTNLFRRRPPAEIRLAESPSGHAPIFSQFGTDIYASDVVQQAVSCIAQEIKKLRVFHVRDDGRGTVPVSGALQRILERPNEHMTTADFLERVTWLLFLNFNAFIVPTYYEWSDVNGLHRKYTGLYPINPSQVDFIQDANNQLFCKFYFNDGTSYILRYTDIIHLRHHYSVNEYMGGDMNGQPDNYGLLKTLQLNKNLLEGVAKSMKVSCTINGIVKYNTMLDEEKMKAALAEFEARLKDSQSGILPIDLKAEYIPIKREVALVDGETLKFIDEKILRHFGVPLCILTGDFTPEQYQAFYQKTLEPLVISYTQAFTHTLFTDGERSFGNKIQFLPKELIFMSMEQTIQMVTLLSNTGALYENEKRIAFGLRPLEELEGKRFMSLNWIDANNADRYQVGKDKEDEDDGI